MTLLMAIMFCASAAADPGCPTLSTFGKHAGQPPPIHPGIVEDAPDRFDWGSEAWFVPSGSSVRGRWSIQNFVANRAADYALAFDWEKASLSSGILRPLPSGYAQCKVVSGNDQGPNTPPVDSDAPIFYGTANHEQPAQLFSAEPIKKAAVTPPQEYETTFSTAYIDGRTKKVREIMIDLASTGDDLGRFTLQIGTVGEQFTIGIAGLSARLTPDEMEDVVAQAKGQDFLVDRETIEEFAGKDVGGEFYRLNQLCPDCIDKKSLISKTQFLFLTGKQNKLLISFKSLSRSSLHASVPLVVFDDEKHLVATTTAPLALPDLKGD